ncbi:hypothetical protein MYK68_02265 [Gordonia sp. PP30]|uniref:purine-cytosine permease family protein n=1 Tax=Gordonia sp. PP30 TaxID=2935861 RepID=UPI001FFF3ACF|nr:hypothetical protein [Gordonia sp. PP30]UQE75469.1 hypothetical protein MYK68_02265 [Gordonia sp. PP30]
MTQATMAAEIPAGVRVVGYSIGDPVEAPIPEAPERRSGWWYFATWLMTPHIEFGAIYMGIVVVLFLHMSLLQALIGIFFGVAFGAVSHGLLTARGVRLKVPQLALGGLAFGRMGNLILTTIMAVISSFGWFIVNSVVAGLAINAIFTSIPLVGGIGIAVVVQLALAQIQVKYRAIQRYLFPVLAVILVVAGIMTFAKVDLAYDKGSPWNFNGIVAVVVVACLAWAYTIGWNPYATDYAARSKGSASPRTAGLCSALGLFCATMFVMSIGVAAGIVIEGDPSLLANDNPTAQFTGYLPSGFGVVVLIVILIGSWTNNAITLKSSRHVFRSGKDDAGQTVLDQVAPLLMTVVGFLLGWAATQDLPANYQGFVMVLGVWIAPWLNVSLVDYLLRRKDDDPTPYLYAKTKTNKWGVISVVFAIAASLLIYGIQIIDGGKLGGADSHRVSYAALGMLAGFYLSAVVYSMGMKKIFKQDKTSAAAKVA